MSLINQMLHDLEQRHTTGMGSSPLRGLSASGSIAQPVGNSINYMVLAVIVAGGFVSAMVMAYLLGNQQQTVATENTAIVTPKKEIPDFIADTLPKSITTTLITAKPEPAVEARKTMIKTIAKKPVAKKIIPKAIKPRVENIIETTPVSPEGNINKIIHPLTGEQKAQLAFQHAIHMLSRNHQQGAQLALEEALSFSPVHFQARETLAAILLNTGRMNEAASVLSEGLQLMPTAAPLAKLYARILVDQDDAAAAVMVLERARPVVATDPEYHALLAALYQQVEKYAQAAHTYRQILLQRPGVASWWMGLALAQDAMGEASLALDAFQRAQRAGGLSDVVLKYIQARIAALTPMAPVFADTDYDLDEFEE